jgi:hypothetical protein
MWALSFIRYETMAMMRFADKQSANSSRCVARTLTELLLPNHNYIHLNYSHTGHFYEMTTFFRYQTPDMTPADQIWLNQLGQLSHALAKEQLNFSEFFELILKTRLSEFSRYRELAVYRISLMSGLNRLAANALVSSINSSDIEFPLPYQLEILYGIEYLKNLGLYKENNFENAKIFKRGNNFINLLKGINNQDHSSNERTQPQRKEVIHLEITKSGFFSIIRTICLAKYIANNLNLSLTVSKEEHWWPYPIRFDYIFPGLVKQVDLQGPTFTTNSLYTYFSNNYEFSVSLNFHICEYYLQIYSLIRDFLAQQGLSSNTTNYSVFLYLRGGDKWLTEGIVIPDVFYVRSLFESLSGSTEPGSIALSSDDYFFAARVQDAFPFKSTNIELAHSSGYFMNEKVATAESVISLLNSFCAGVSADKCLGDTSSNYVNAMSWTRLALRGYDSICFPNSVHPCRIFS